MEAYGETGGFEGVEEGEEHGFVKLGNGNLFIMQYKFNRRWPQRKIQAEVNIKKMYIPLLLEPYPLPVFPIIAVLLFVQWQI